MLRSIIALALLTATSVLADERHVTNAYDTVNVADGVVAFVALESKTAIVNGNSVAVIGDDGVLVVDSGQFPTLARRMIADIRKLTDKPVRFVVNTHWHWDHNLANYVYRDAFPGVVIVSTPFTRDFIARYTPRFIEGYVKHGDAFLERMRAQAASGKNADGTAMSVEQKAELADTLHDAVLGMPEVRQARVEPPNETFTDALTVHLGRREVKILFLGRGNTAGDAVVYVPDAKVLITGDLVVNPTPYATASYISDWIVTLRKLHDIDAAAIVPGHGPVEHDKRYIETVASLLESIDRQVRAAVQKGLDLEATRKAVDIEEFRRQLAGDDRARNAAFSDYFVQPVVESAWKQAKGMETSESPFPAAARSGSDR